MRPRFFCACVLGVLTCFGWASACLAQPVVDPSTQRAYERVVGTLKWSEAQAAASARVFNGRTGHLATITSAAEQAFIVANLGGASGVRGCWLGGFQPTGSTEPAGGWRWITGEAWSYTNWDSNEPNNASGFGGGTFEDALQFKQSNSFDRWNDFWRDSVDTTWVRGYIVEWEGACAIGLSAVSSVLRCPGSPAEFSVSPTGLGPYTYRWRKNGVPIALESNPSASTPNLTLISVQSSDIGSYDCQVSNACVTVTSASASLTVLPDFNADGAISTPDLTFFLGRFGQPATPGTQAARADFNADGVVNTADLTFFLGRFGSACP